MQAKRIKAYCGALTPLWELTRRFLFYGDAKKNE